MHSLADFPSSESCSSELSDHSSDEELDQFIIASPFQIQQTRELSTVLNRRRKKDQPSPDSEDHMETEILLLCKQFFTEPLLDFKIKTPSEMVFGGVRLEKRAFFGQPNQANVSKSIKKKKDFDQFDKKCVDSQVKVWQGNDFGESNWLQSIFDQINDRSRRLIQRLKREFGMASTIYQKWMIELVRKYIKKFKEFYYDPLKDLRTNLIQLICYLAENISGQKSKIYLKDEAKVNGSNLELEF